MEEMIAVVFWLGQSCFVIQTQNVTILTDPFNTRMGYDVQRVDGIDVVTVSHEHGDHNYVAMAAGEPVVLRGLTEKGAEFNPVDQQVKGVRIRTVPSYHDDVQGAKRGKNAIFVFEIPSNPPVRLVHMGDFGEKQIGAERLKAIGSTDILFLPVGGFYTIGAAEADQVLADLRPRIVVPMHYKTARTPRLPIQELAPFLQNKKQLVDRDATASNRLVITASLLKKAQAAAQPLIAPLDFGQPPKPRQPTR